MAATQLGFNISVPAKDAFGGAPFKHAPELAVLSDRVQQAHHPRFSLVGGFTVDYIWQARATTRRGEPVLADCLKPGGLTHYYSTCDFVIVFNAANLEDLGLTDRQYEALMFECLCHIGSNENTGSPVLLPYDFSGFNASLSAYGPWRENLRKMAHAVRAQPTLFEVADVEEEAGQVSADPDSPIPGTVETADAVPAEVQPTQDLSADFMRESGWPVDPPHATNGHHVDAESDAEAEREFATARRRRGGAE
jgi:hypothetical protein